jgi:molybdopterin molybdotransferase
MTPEKDTHGCQCDSQEANRGLLSVDQARTIAVELAEPVSGSVLLPLGEALGRTAFKTLHAPAAMPFFDNSAMDGYAVATGALDGKGPWSLEVCGTIAAGAQPEILKLPDAGGRAVRIFTGAPVPNGFDGVIAQENCQLEHDRIVFDSKPQSGTNVRYAGSDTKRGAILIEAGTRIAPHHAGLLAANGYGAINVRKLPRVAVFSTGDELAAPGEKAAAGQIYDCNKPMLLALLAELGIKAADLGALPDDLAATRELLNRCRDEYDLIVSSGSASVGERDYLKDAFTAAGGSIRNWKVAVKPGKPVVFGRLGKAVFTALPGNPFAAFVGFQLFLKPQISKLCGLKEARQQNMAAIADFSWDRKTGRAEVFPVKLTGCDQGELPRLERLGNSVSATLFPLTTADGLARVGPECAAVRPGDPLEWQPFCK